MVGGRGRRRPVGASWEACRTPDRRIAAGCGGCGGAFGGLVVAPSLGFDAISAGGEGAVRVLRVGGAGDEVHGGGKTQWAVLYATRTSVVRGAGYPPPTLRACGGRSQCGTLLSLCSGSFRQAPCACLWCSAQSIHAVPRRSFCRFESSSWSGRARARWQCVLTPCSRVGAHLRHLCGTFVVPYST